MNPDTGLRESLRTDANRHAADARPPRARADQAARLRALVAEHETASEIEPPAAAGRRGCPVVAITSGKGGVGKTTLCVNLAIALAGAGHRVTLLDADLGLANADVLCGINPSARLDAVLHAASGASGGPESVLERIAIDAPGGFRLIPGSVGLRGGESMGPQMRELVVAALGRIEETSDIVLVDTGAGIGAHVTGFLESADAVVVVASPEPTSIADAYALIKCVYGNVAKDAATDAPAISLLINQAIHRREGEDVHRRISAVCARFLRFEPGLVGIVERDDSAGNAVRERRPALVSYPKSRFSRDVRHAAASLAELLDVRRSEGVGERRGLLARLLGR